MIGEFIAEVILKTILEIVLGGIFYHTGALVLSILTLGALPLAPLDSWGDKERGEDRWYRWSVWRTRPGKRRELKAEWVAVAGVIVWIGIGALVYSTSRDSPESASSQGAEERQGASH